MQLAHSELIAIENDLSDVQTQELILRQRQSELGKWLNEDLKNGASKNPTISELVMTESDRLALLAHRLRRLKAKLLSQKNELISFLKLNDKVSMRSFYLAEQEKEVEPERENIIIVDEDDIILP